MRESARAPLPLLFMLVASAVVPLLLLLGSGISEHFRMQATARASVERLTALAKEHALKVVETNGLVLARIEDLVRGQDWDGIARDAATIHQQMRAMEQGLEQPAPLHLVRPDGRLEVLSNAWPTPRFDLSQRDYFRMLAAGANSPVFGMPVRNAATGVVSFAMARRRAAPEGVFDGVLIASLLPSYFERHWATMAGAEDYTFGLLRRDGTALAHYPAASATPQSTAAPTTLANATETRMTLAEVAGPDGTRWLTGFRQVGAHDLYVSVGLSLSSVRAAWWQHLAVTGITCLLAALALGFASVSAIRRWHAEQAARARLQVTADVLRAEIERREAAEAGLQQAQRLEALGRLTGGVAHDFNNLLTAILGTVTMLERHLGSALDDKARRMLASAKDAVAHGARLNAGLLAFARRQPLRVAAVDANALLRRFSPLVRQALGEAAPLTLELAADLPACRADASQLEAAVLNLAINARDAMPRGGSVTLRTGLADLGAAELGGNADARPGRFVTVALSDSGLGMPPAVRERAFEPFFTTKPTGKGTGLGLSQVFGFVRQLGGHVTIESPAEGGTTVTLYLPLEQDVAAPAPSAPEVEPVFAVARSTVLMAEDDAKVRDVTADMLRDAGFRVLAARDGQEALGLLRRGEQVDVLFSDVVMPGGLNGFELAEEARRLRPGLPVLLTSGYAGSVNEPAGHDHDLLPKPYDRATLLRRIAALAGCGTRGAA